MNYLHYLRKLAASIEYQNLFLASKEINGIRLFRNNYNLSKLQSIFLSYLYMFQALYSDIDTHKISDKVLEDEIYADSYLLWRKEKGFQYGQEDKKDSIVFKKGKGKIKFPNKG